MEHSGKDNAAGRNPEQNERVDVFRSQDHFKIRASKSIDPMLSTANIVSFGSDHRMNCTRGALKQLLVFC